METNETTPGANANLGGGNQAATIFARLTRSIAFIRWPNRPQTTAFGPEGESTSQSAGDEVSGGKKVRPYTIDDFENRRKPFDLYFQLVPDDKDDKSVVPNNEQDEFLKYINGTVGNLTNYADSLMVMDARDACAAELRKVATSFMFGNDEALECLKQTARQRGRFEEKAEVLREIPPSYEINDNYFINHVKRLKELRSFLIQEAVCPDNTNLPSSGKLNLLQYNSNGRTPREDEWRELDRATQVLFGLLTEPLRKRFFLGEIPSWMVTLPLALAIIALTSLIYAIFLPYQAEPILVLPPYLVWLMSLGAIGAIAFIGMNALSVQEDVTFDLTNRRLLFLRITLGALFGLVLTLPFGFPYFIQFCNDIRAWRIPSAQQSPPQVTYQSILLLLPFVLGFSTSLVIMILNRLVDSVQAFFGKPSSGGTILRKAPPLQ